MTTRGQDLNAAIAALWTRQRDEMLRRVDVVEAGVAALSFDTLDPEQRDASVDAAHKIAGAAGTFGFDSASVHAREIEIALRAGASPADAPRMAELVAQIHSAFREAPAKGDRKATPIDDIDVLIACGERFDATEVIAHLRACGLRVAAIAAGDDAAQAPRAGVAIVDLDDPSANRFLERVGRPKPVLIGIAGDAGLDARVGFTRRGGRTLLPADVRPAEVAEAVQLIRETVRDSGARILVVDDDPGILELTTTILRGHDLDVTPLEDPSRFWQTLEMANPEVLLLDLEMPGFNGADLCRAVRADPRWSQLPILFLTGRTEPESIREVFDAGADDCLTKPVVEGDLVQRIDKRLERVRQLRDLADKDALTGVSTRRRAAEQLTRLERIAKRHGQPLTFAILDLDHFKQVNDSFGHATGDEVLRRLGRRLQGEFRGEDVVGRWGGEEFVVGMYGMPGSLAVERLNQLLEDWKDERFDDPQGGAFTTSFTVGLAELPAAAATLDELQRAADDALYRGKAAGRARVHIAGSHEDTAGVEHVDVALVEDDAALVELLTPALSGEGWSARVFDNGADALEALAADPPRLHARLVLLDWNLPGANGFEVIERLRASGVLGRTRVVMLTARADEGEVVRALEVGASDYIAKPFSLPVLLLKIRQALGDR